MIDDYASVARAHGGEDMKPPERLYESAGRKTRLGEHNNGIANRAFDVCPDHHAAADRLLAIPLVYRVRIPI